MPMESFEARRGDIFRLTGAGGGGYGAPLARECWRVAEDVREGKVSIEGAKRDYGVVFLSDGVTVDVAATGRVRAAQAGTET